jgi:hypothetical protein
MAPSTYIVSAMAREVRLEGRVPDTWFPKTKLTIARLLKHHAIEVFTNELTNIVYSY